jgi:hypothetical protein
MNAWEQVSNEMPGRKPRHCQDRWYHYLADPSVNHPWTPEEDALLMQCMEKYGRKWTTIARMFANRSDIEVRNRWTVIYEQPRTDLQDDALQPRTKIRPQELEPAAKPAPKADQGEIPDVILLPNGPGQQGRLLDFWGRWDF